MQILACYWQSDFKMFAFLLYHYYQFFYKLPEKTISIQYITFVSFSWVVIARTWWFMVSTVCCIVILYHRTSCVELRTITYVTKCIHLEKNNNVYTFQTILDKMVHTQDRAIKCTYFQCGIHPTINNTMILENMLLWIQPRTVLFNGLTVHSLCRLIPGYSVCRTVTNVVHFKEWVFTLCVSWYLEINVNIQLQYQSN